MTMASSRKYGPNTGRGSPPWHPQGTIYGSETTLIYPLTDNRYLPMFGAGDVLVVLAVRSESGLFLCRRDGEECIANGVPAPDAVVIGRVVGVMRGEPRGPWQTGRYAPDVVAYVNRRDAEGFHPVMWETGHGPAPLYEILSARPRAELSRVSPDHGALSSYLREHGRVIYGVDMTAHPSMPLFLANAIGSRRLGWASWWWNRTRLACRRIFERNSPCVSPR